MPVAFDPEKASINKEKLLICCSIVLKRVRVADNKIDRKKGLTYDKMINGKLSVEERSFMLKDTR